MPLLANNVSQIVNITLAAARNEFGAEVERMCQLFEEDLLTKLSEEISGEGKETSLLSGLDKKAAVKEDTALTTEAELPAPAAGAAAAVQRPRRQRRRRSHRRGGVQPSTTAIASKKAAALAESAAAAARLPYRRLTRAVQAASTCSILVAVSSVGWLWAGILQLDTASQIPPEELLVLSLLCPALVLWSYNRDQLLRARHKATTSAAAPIAAVSSAELAQRPEMQALLSGVAQVAGMAALVGAAFLAARHPVALAPIVVCLPLALVYSTPLLKFRGRRVAWKSLPFAKALIGAMWAALCILMPHLVAEDQPSTAATAAASVAAAAAEAVDGGVIPQPLGGVTEPRLPPPPSRPPAAANAAAAAAAAAATAARAQIGRSTSQRALLLGLGVAFCVNVSHMLQDMRDVELDRRRGVLSAPVLVGRTGARVLAAGSAAAAAACFRAAGCHPGFWVVMALHALVLALWYDPAADAVAWRLPAELQGVLAAVASGAVAVWQRANASSAADNT